MNSSDRYNVHFFVPIYTTVGVVVVILVQLTPDNIDVGFKFRVISNS